MKIEDNFLEQNDLIKIQKLIMSDSFTWFYNPFSVVPTKTEIKNDYQFTHTFYKGHYHYSDHFSDLNPIINKLNPIALFRIKTNLLTRTSSIVEQSFHIDIGPYYWATEEKLKQMTTSIFYVNTNNGYTKFEDGTKVESVANRMVSFSTNMKHLGTSCTDQNRRVVINFNYFK